MQINLDLQSEQMRVVYARNLIIQNALHSALDISQNSSSARDLVWESKDKKPSLQLSLLPSLHLSLNPLLNLRPSLSLSPPLSPPPSPPLSPPLSPSLSPPPNLQLL